MALTSKQAPFIEPYALPDNPKGFKSKGPTAEAVKRALAHLGFMEWKGDYDQHWNKEVNTASMKWKKKRGLIPQDSSDGSWGEKAHDVMRSAWYAKSGDELPAFDGYSQNLLQNEAKQTSASDEEDVFQKFFVEFCNAAIKNEAAWHYDQDRAIDVSVNPSASSVNSDCSGFGIQAAYYAKQKSGLDVQDPSKQNFTGWGNTDQFEDDWPKVAAPFRVGDAGHFSSPRHVIWCIKAGSVSDAEWVSHGQESGPDRIKLPSYSRYPDEFMFVVRPAYI